MRLTEIIVLKYDKRTEILNIEMETLILFRWQIQKFAIVTLCKWFIGKYTGANVRGKRKWGVNNNYVRIFSKIMLTTNFDRKCYQIM